jgi:hypothetical protein
MSLIPCSVRFIRIIYVAIVPLLGSPGQCATSAFALCTLGLDVIVPDDD